MLLTLDEAAEWLTVSRRTVQRLIGRGDLSSVRVGNQIRIEPEAIELFIKNHREGKTIMQESEFDITTLDADTLIKAHPDYQEATERLQNAEGELATITARLSELTRMDQPYMSPEARIQLAVEFDSNRDALNAAIRECTRAKMVAEIAVLDVKARKDEVLHEALSPYVGMIEAARIEAEQRMRKASQVFGSIVTPCRSYKRSANGYRIDANGLRKELARRDALMVN